MGRSIRDNQLQPPSVLVAQLRDHIAQGWCCPDEGDPLLSRLTCEHPLQPFSLAYFDPRSGGDKRLFTYAREWREVHAVSEVEPSSEAERTARLAAGKYPVPESALPLPAPPGGPVSG